MDTLQTLTVALAKAVMHIISAPVSFRKYEKENYKIVV